MDKSKKALSIILILCFLTALCAVGISAESSIVPTDHMSREDQFALFGWSCDPDYFVYDSGTLLGTVNGRNYYKRNNGASISCLCLKNYTSPVSVAFSSSDCIFYFANYNGSVQSVDIDSVTFYKCSDYGWQNPSSYSSDLPILDFRGITETKEALVSFVLESAGFSTSSPEPDPGPSYSDFSSTGYFHNFKTWDDSLPWNSESSYSWSRPAIEVQLGTEPEYAVVYNKRSLFLSYVADGDYSDILTDLTVISGQVGVRVEKPNWGQSYQTSIDYYSPDHSLCNGFVLLTNGIDPYESGFQSFIVPNTWSTRFVVWQVPLSSYTSQFYFDYYFILPEDFVSIIGFTPSYIMFYFDSVYTYVSSEDGSTHTSLSYPVPNVDYWYWLTGLSIQYQKRSSSSTPSLPPSTVDPEYIDGQNQVDYGLEQEYQKTMDYYQGDSQLTSALSVFNLTNLAGSFQSLYNGLTYSGTDFTFKLPEASVPAIANVTTGFNLWQEQTIPLKEAIDNIPTPVLIIIRFIAWLGVGGAVFLTIKTLLSDLNGGNRDESSG